MITAEQKTEIKKKFGQSANDSGSPEIQVAIITTRIENLSPHFAKHSLDYSGKRGLMKLVGQRKALLSYLAKKDVVRYQKLVKSLGLRK